MVDRTNTALTSEEDIRNVPIGSTLRISERGLITPPAADLITVAVVVAGLLADPLL
jgi:hypothetical protein